MTGLCSGHIEAVAALALGVFPLLISAAEHFDETVRPFKRCKNSARDVETTIHRLILDQRFSRPISIILTFYTL